MAKRKRKSKGFKLSLSVMITLICALVMVVAYFLPFQTIKAKSIITNEVTTTQSGADFTEALFSGENEEFKEMAENNEDLKDIQVNSFLVNISAFSCILLGVLLLVGLLLGVLLNNALLLKICKIVAFLAVVFAILGIIGGFTLAGKLSFTSIISYQTLVGISAYLYAIASIVGFGSLILIKK